MNEFQVGMGESSCAAKLWTTPIKTGNGKALFNIGELMTVALERSKTAREAILVCNFLFILSSIFSFPHLFMYVFFLITFIDNYSVIFSSIHHLTLI